MPPPLRAAAGMGLSYREMADNDLPFLAELYASTRREEVALTGWPQELQEGFLRQQFDAQHAHYSTYRADSEWLIVEQGKEAVGRLYWRDQPDRMHVIDISLMPAHRGHGLGGAILRDLLALAAERGKDLTIYVEKMNPARRLYARLGFEVVADEGVYDLMRARP